MSALSLSTNPDGPALERPLGERGALLHRQHDDRGVRNLSPEPPDRLDAGSVGHLQVEHEHMRDVGGYTMHHRGEVRCLGDHVQPFLAVEQVTQVAPYRGVVIGDDHPDRRSRPGHGSWHRGRRSEMQTCAHTLKLRAAGLDFVLGNRWTGVR